MAKLKAGELFQNRYRIISELGAGGMGLVFHATQTDADRDVALKLMRSDQIKDQDSIDRFYREFKLLSRLSHPHIMTLYGMSLDEESLPYAVCEYIEGESLRSLLNREGPLTWQRVARIVLQTAAALQYAHELEVVHRDLKPDNIMLLQTPEPDYVKLVDFGLSRALYDSGDVQKLTATGQLIGSANYMSPELIKAKADGRSDIYSLGCVVFELLSAEHLFDADTPVGIVFRHCNDDPQERYSAIKAEVPQRLLTILSKMLAKDPDARQQNMQDLSDDWQALLADPGTAYKADSAPNSWMLKPAVIAALASLALVLPCGGLIAYQSFKHSPDEKQKTKQKNRQNVPKVLPRRGVSMVELLKVEYNRNQASLMARRWLELHLNQSDCPAKDKILVLNKLAGIESARHRDLLEGDARQKAFLLTKQLGQSQEDIILRYQTFDMLAEYFRTQGKRAKAIELAQSVLNYIRANDDRHVFNNVSQGSVGTLLFCGQYAEALAAQESFVKKFDFMADLLFCRVFFALLGDAQISNGMTKEALQSYLESFETTEALGAPAVLTNMAIDHARRLSRITGVKTRDESVVAQASDFLVLASVAIRIHYIDPELARKQFKAIVAAAIETQNQMREAAKGKKNSSDNLLNYSQWMDLSEYAANMNLPETALICAEQTVDSYKHLPATEPGLPEIRAYCLTYKALRLMQAGKIQQSDALAGTIEKTFEPLGKDLAVPFWTHLSRAAQQQHRNDLAQKYYRIAELLSARRQMMRQPDLEICTELAHAAHELNDQRAEEKYWKIVLARLPRVAGSYEVNSFVEHLRMLVATMLDCGKIEEALAYANSNAIEHEASQLGKVLVLTEIGKYYIRNKQFPEAIKVLEEARERCQKNYCGEREKPTFHLPHYLVINLLLSQARTASVQTAP